MAKPAYVMLSSTGAVVKTHYVPASSLGTTSNANDLEAIIKDGYSPVREIPLDGGGALIVLSK